MAIATINGQITFFNPVTGQQTGNIDGRGDLTVGRSDTDLVMPKKTRVFFTTLSYRYVHMDQKNEGQKRQCLQFYSTISLKYDKEGRTMKELCCQVKVCIQCIVFKVFAASCFSLS